MGQKPCFCGTTQIDALQRPLCSQPNSRASVITGEEPVACYSAAAFRTALGNPFHRTPIAAIPPSAALYPCAFSMYSSASSVCFFILYQAVLLLSSRFLHFFCSHFYPSYSPAYAAPCPATRGAVCLYRAFCLCRRFSVLFSFCLPFIPHTYFYFGFLCVPSLFSCSFFPMIDKVAFIFCLYSLGGFYELFNACVYRS